MPEMGGQGHPACGGATRLRPPISDVQTVRPRLAAVTAALPAWNSKGNTLEYTYQISQCIIQHRLGDERVSINSYAALVPFPLESQNVEITFTSYPFAV